MKDRKFVAMTAQMDGTRAIVKDIGRMRNVSEMELVVLCTFAEIGMLSIFSELDGEFGHSAQDDLDATINAVGQLFRNSGNEGMTMLSATCAAMLRGERFGQYVPRVTEEK